MLLTLKGRREGPLSPSLCQASLCAEVVQGLLWRRVPGVREAVSPEGHSAILPPVLRLAIRWSSTDMRIYVGCVRHVICANRDPLIGLARIIDNNSNREIEHNEESFMF